MHRALIQIAFLGGLLGGLFAILSVEQSRAYFFYGFLDGFFIALLMGYYSFYLKRRNVFPWIKSTRFANKVYFNSLVYILLFLVGRSIGHLLSLRSPFFEFNKVFWLSLALSIFTALLINFLIEVVLLIGKPVTMSFIKGTYHRPIEENRIFLFVDLASSTSIAEKLGNSKFLDLLSLFFRDLGDAVMQTGGEIYKYVGDEAIISWPVRGCGRSPLDCYLKFAANVETHLTEYNEKFMIKPKYWASIHGGTIVAGELGEAKKEIAYLGDVVNTTARLMEVARSNNTSIVLSEQAIEQMNLSTSSSAFSELNEDSVRGRSTKIKLYSLAQ
jgi:adenylate cyclase